MRAGCGNAPVVICAGETEIQPGVDKIRLEKYNTPVNDKYFLTAKKRKVGPFPFLKREGVPAESAFKMQAV